MDGADVGNGWDGMRMEAVLTLVCMPYAAPLALSSIFISETCLFRLQHHHRYGQHVHDTQYQLLRLLFEDDDVGARCRDGLSAALDGRGCWSDGA